MEFPSVALVNVVELGEAVVLSPPADDAELTEKSIFKNSLDYLNKFNNFALILVNGNPNPTIHSENNHIIRSWGERF